MLLPLPNSTWTQIYSLGQCVASRFEAKQFAVKHNMWFKGKFTLFSIIMIMIISVWVIWSHIYMWKSCLVYGFPHHTSKVWRIIIIRLIPIPYLYKSTNNFRLMKNAQMLIKWKWSAQSVSNFHEMSLFIGV